MLINLLCDDSCIFVDQFGVTELHVEWVVDADVPLDDPEQIRSLNFAISKELSEEINDQMYVSCFVDYNILLQTSGEPLGTRYTPSELGLRDGVELRLVRAAKKRKKLTLFSGSASSSRQLQQSESKYFDGSQSFVNTEDGTDGDCNEFYMSSEVGWFPFLPRQREEGCGPLVLINDMLVPVNETDTEPNTRPLCEACSAVVSRGDALRVAVDRHYKPAFINHAFLEVCMEKLGGGKFCRWQKRYVQISEKSIDWFVEKPRPGVKSRIHGHRYFVLSGECQVDALIRDPNPEMHPYCRDSSFHYFAISFRNPSKIYFFRATTADQKAEVIDFFEKCISRIEKRAPIFDPVTWKRKVDALLLNAAELAETQKENSEYIATIQGEIYQLESELSEVAESTLRLQETRDAQVQYVQTLRAEIMLYEANMKRAQERIKKAQALVAEEERLLREEEIAMAGELREVSMLKNYAFSQHEACEKRILELRKRAESLQEQHNDVFRRWCSLEEQHRLQRHKSRHTGLYSFSEDGIGISSGSRRISTELAASITRLALSSPQLSPQPKLGSSTSPSSPQRQLLFSNSPERSV